MRRNGNFKHAYYLVVFTLLLFLQGCIGPRGLEATRYRYNEAIQRTDAEELLLNLVRLRYVDSTVDLPVSALNSQFALESGTSFSGIYGLRSEDDGTVNLNISERPTITFNPTASDDAASAFLTPFELEELAFLATSYDIGRVFRLFATNVNNLDNASTADGPQRHTPPRHYREFIDFATIINELQKLQAIKFGIGEKTSTVGVAVSDHQFDAATQLNILKEGFTITELGNNELIISKQSEPRIVKFEDNEITNPVIGMLTTMLELKSGKDEFELNLAAKGFFGKQPPFSKIHIGTRSLLQAQFFVSQGVQLPDEHIQCGLAPVAYNDDGSLFDWSLVLDDLFCVKCSKRRPKCARVAVHHRGYWFFIDDSDQDSIKTLHLLQYATRLARLRTSDKDSKAPTLTLPVGR